MKMIEIDIDNFSEFISKFFIRQKYNIGCKLKVFGE